jgi:hypothetical protein
MDVIHKDATITPTGVEGDFPGTFEVILSAPTLDRDGDTLATDGWKTPLPDHITFDSDHGMSVATTVGSGVPSIDEKTGNLVVSGTYSSLARAQEVRTLVNEGHIRTTSVAFMSEKSTKDGKSVTKRELLNGAFVAIPSNREALVLSSKTVKAGARNSAGDMAHVQGIHDHAAAMGADCAAAKSAKSATTKSVVGSLEATQDRARDALNYAYGTGAWVYLRATLPDTLVFDISVEDSSDTETYQQSYTDDGSVVTLTGERGAVDVAEVVTSDPDEDAADSGAPEVPAAGAEKSAPAAVTKDAPVEEVDSDAVTTKQLEELALRIQAEQFI